MYFTFFEHISAVEALFTKRYKNLDLLNDNHLPKWLLGLKLPDYWCTLSSI